MTKKTYVSLYFLIILSKIFAQSPFEITIPWGDTSVTAHIAQETPDGNFIILATNVQAPPEDGYWYEPMIYGPSLTKISAAGDILWKKLYLTTGLLPGLFPKQYFLLQDEQYIILPIEIGVGTLMCYETDNYTIDSESTKHALLKIKPDDGEILQAKRFWGDTLCSWDKLVSTTTTSNQIRLIVFDNLNHDYFSIENIDKETFNVVQRDTFSTNIYDVYNLVYNNSTNSLIKLTQLGLDFYDLSGNLHKQFRKPSYTAEDTLFYGHGKVVANEKYYVSVYIGSEDEWYFDRSYQSLLLIFDTDGNFISQRFFPKEKITDIAISENNEVLVLSNSQNRNYEDILSLPIKVRKYDLDLNLMASKDYGFPFIEPSRIGFFSNNRFHVEGRTVRPPHNSISWNRQWQVYFLVDDLNNLTTNTDSEDYDLNIFPNPFSGALNVHYKDDYIPIKLELFDALGRKIFGKTVFNGESIDVSTIPDGLYFYQTVNNAGRLLKAGKLIKKE